MPRFLAPRLALSALLSLASVPLAAQFDGVLTGVVYDSVAGAPLAGARVLLAGSDRGATTDSAGTFRIPDLGEGRYGVLFDHPRMDRVGWMPDTLWTRVAAGGETPVRLAIPSLLRLAVLGCRSEGQPGTSVLAGRVADAGTGQPIPGARVSISWAGAAPTELASVAPARVRADAVAGDEGMWYACDLPQGVPVVARVDQPGYARRELSYFFEAPSVAQAEFLLTRGGRGQTSFLTGTVRSQADGAPLQGAVVSVEGTSLSAMSNEFGFWELSNVPPGERMLRVRHAGAERALPVRVPEGGVADIEVRVAPDAYTLAPITVTAARDLGVLQGFYERRQTGYGQFVTRAEVQRRGAFRATDLLAGMRRSREWCGPLMFLDGVLVRDASIIDAVSVSDVEGVEYYATGVSTPPEFLRDGGRCSVFAVWTRRGGAPLAEQP